MRIIAGKHKGLKLNTFDFDGTRPTADKVREAIFSKIQFSIMDSTCLDLFGGTGAIALELLSRGAKEVTICDKNPRSIKLIKENSLKAKETPKVFECDYQSCLKKLIDADSQFDIIFLDPPFKSDCGLNSIKIIENSNLLKDDGILIYECDKNTVIKLDQFQIFDEKIYGTIKVYYINKGSNVKDS